MDRTKFTFRIRTTTIVWYGFHSFFKRSIFWECNALKTDYAGLLFCFRFSWCKILQREELLSFERNMVYSTYKRQCIVRYMYHLQGYKAPTIAKLLVEDGCKASRVGIAKFLEKYRETGCIGRRIGSCRSSKIALHILRIWKLRTNLEIAQYVCTLSRLRERYLRM